MAISRAIYHFPVELIILDLFCIIETLHISFIYNKCLRRSAVVISAKYECDLADQSSYFAKAEISLKWVHDWQYCVVWYKTILQNIFLWPLCKHIMTSSNGNIFRVTVPWCGEFTGQRWIPHTKASDAELWCFLDLRLNKRLGKQSWGWWFETPSRSLWRHCNGTW